MRKALLVVLACMATGCGESKEVTGYWNMPEGLRDCKVYRVSMEDSGASSSVRVVRCPLSAVSVRDGKHDNALIEGESEDLQEAVRRLTKQVEALTRAQNGVQ